MLRGRLSGLSVLVSGLVLVGFLTNSKAFAQDGVTARVGSSPSIQMNVRSTDRAAARNVLEFRYHVLPARTEAAKGLPLEGPEPFSLPAARKSAPAAAKAAVTRVPSPGFYPADLSNLGGAVLTSTVFNNVYVNCPNQDQSCWGNPVGFQNDLVKSKFIHLVDQYVGSKAKNRYAVGAQFTTSAPGLTFLTLEDIFAIVHAVASDTADGGGSGRGHIINVFLPQGTDTCMDPGNTQCYSPDVPSTFTFCGYHFDVVFNDIGETLFTVEPFQNVPGCAVAEPSPNGQQADSTNSTLSHETFETITDPEPGNGTFGWIAINSLNELGFEIGDECQGPPNSSSDAIVPTFAINGKQYEVQLEYSNKYHACANTP
jgi:hypothetical protein